ncbi:MAG: cytochrome c biogenesis protein ResB [Sulfuricellaceae bacterium]|nr:cytochrome c biogenesis protein ResB [Sulfuricellaceae bacterium]
MRFAISLLTVLAIASIIGTVLKQNEPYPNYVMQFGQYWFETFKTLGLYDVYHSGWFISILGFLILSTGMCIFRNTPLMLKEMRSYREHATEISLRAFSHQAEFSTPLSATETQSRLAAYLTGHGFRAKTTQMGETDILVAAKAGSYHRIGYMLTHTAIVVICLGGLIDGNLPLKAQQLLGWKTLETRDIPQSDVPPASRLSPSNLSFRGGVTIPEGAGADVIFLNIADGYLVQELPFDILLNKFRIEHYPTGQPKSFESDITLIDKESQQKLTQTISVNHPLIYKGIAIYQASFGDGGSKLHMKGWNLFSPTHESFAMEGVVKQATQLSNGDASYTVEFTEFRKFNIEDFAKATESGGMLQNMSQFLQSGSNKSTKKDLRNVGPSFQFKIRDAQGQAREFFNYMQPIQLEEHWYLLSGVRNAPNEPFRYVRFPLDAKLEIDSFMRLRAILLDKASHPEIARRFATFALQGDKVDGVMLSKLVDSTAKILEIFSTGGFEAMAKFIEKTVPADEQDKAAQTYIRIIESAAVSAYTMSHERASLPAAEMNENSLRFVRDSINAISDLFAYGAPVYLQLSSFDEIQASGLQLTRSPGKNIVYGGSALLVLGVFFMFYVRERRLWLLVKPGSGSVLLAMSSNRKTLDFEHDFGRHLKNIRNILKD